MKITSSLADLQTEEQRRVLDTVAQVRKCGLESILSLPQLIVCGDQSAGKSSVLEALTEIPFPRNDNLCTRFATEIILRRAPNSSLTIKIISDDKRPPNERAQLEAFKESITNFDELPRIMDLATKTMGLGGTPPPGLTTKAFAMDILSIEIEGPSRPQLTLVDIPGLIQTDTKGVTKADVQLVAELTDQFISRSRTICLAVVSAANDYANQRILTKVREVDPEGNRTLGIITKPDRLPSGSGAEKSFIELACNEDIFLKLGWHELKNRKFEEKDLSLTERNASEDTDFRTSNFKVLPATCVGIVSLRARLSILLFDHVKQELPKLRSDLDEALAAASKQLELLGSPRASSVECKEYLTTLSLDYYEVCKAAVDGHYEGEYFTSNAKDRFSFTSPETIRRIRAVVQMLNSEFAEKVRVNDEAEVRVANSAPMIPIKMNKMQALGWVNRAIARTRGRELIGNFNPLLVGELFWEQSSRWKKLAMQHLDEVSDICTKFLNLLLEDKCPTDVTARLRTSLIQDSLKKRYADAALEIERLIEDTRSYPINYNHYYTDTVQKRRQDRQKKDLSKCIKDSTSHQRLDGCTSTHTSASVNVEEAMEKYSQHVDPNMHNVSCEEVLDCLYAIYKVSQKTFIANITTQVIERHMIRGLEKIFSPVIVNRLTNDQVEAIVSEPDAAKRQRQFLDDRIKKLKDGQAIFKGVMGGG